MPFGEELTPDSTYKTANLKYNLGDGIRQKFTSYQRDEETLLDFAEARMYENRHARFIAVDPLLASGKSANPQTFNRYIYCLNNPLIYTDPSGLQVGDRKDQIYVNANETSFQSGPGKGYEPYAGNGKMFPAKDGYTYRIHAKGKGWTQVGKTDPNLFDVAAQAVSDTALGAGGSVYNGAASFSNAFWYVANRATWEYIATGVPRESFAPTEYYEFRTPGEQSASFTFSFLSLYYGAASAGTTSAAPSFAGFTTAEATGPVTAFRVEGTANQMLSIGENGEVAVTSNRMLFLNFGDAARAESFAARRVAQGMEGVEIKSFQVDRQFFNDVRQFSVPESQRSIFPASPISVDTQFSNQFGLPSCQLANLCRSIVPGSGRTTSVGN